MEDLNMNKLDENELSAVDGGVGGSHYIDVDKISPMIWVTVTSTSLCCRYSPDGDIAKVYEKGHRLQVNGITGDKKWYRLIIYDPRTKNGTCDGYIEKKYTAKD